MALAASINFRNTQNIGVALAHNFRASPPAHLVAPQNTVYAFGVHSDEIKARFEAKRQLASRQALAKKGYSPFWEGILNLPETNDLDVLKKIVKDFKADYQALTGHRVLGFWIHLDEGHVAENGEVKLNRHAHIIADRTDENGRVLRCTRKELKILQDLAAKTTGLKRGKPARETGAKHLHHVAFKRKIKEQQIEVEKAVEPLKAELAQTQSHAANLEILLANEKEKYALERARMQAENKALKERGEAVAFTQKDYSKLKLEHAAALERIEAVTKDLNAAVGVNLQLTHELEVAKKVKPAPEPEVAPGFFKRIDLRTENKALKEAVAELTETNTSLLQSRTDTRRMLSGISLELEKMGFKPPALEEARSTKKGIGLRELAAIVVEQVHRLVALVRELRHDAPDPQLELGSQVSKPRPQTLQEAMFPKGVPTFKTKKKGPDRGGGDIDR
jgi:hypothetical protein